MEREEESYSLIHIISSNRWGGAQRYAFEICRHFHRLGSEVTAMTRDAKTVDDHFREAGISLLHAPLRGFFDPASAFILAARLREMPLSRSIIHVHRYRDAFTAFLAKRIAKRPDIRIVSTRHTIRPGRNSWIFRRMYNKINAHIFVSQAAFDRFASSWRNLPFDRGNVRILLNSVDAPVASPMPEPERGPVHALYVGPVVAGKGIETIIDALVKLRDIKLRLRIAGQGNPDYLDLLRRRAMARNVMDVIDWRISSNPDYGKLISEAHFTVLPSTEREAFGLSNISAMACGRPQITSPNGAQSEYLTDGETALFVPPADAQALADAMRRLATDPQLRKNIGDAAYAKYARELSWENFIHSLEGIYSDTFS